MDVLLNKQHKNVNQMIIFRRPRPVLLDFVMENLNMQIVINIKGNFS
jgi:hypothetical protein